VNQMSLGKIQGVDFVVANTDRVHLEKCVPTTQLQLGRPQARSCGC
jgi:cell division protein FtsZ